ncbi:MAG: Ig-like domain-containing protein [Verrucomicrobiae bacterium]|nr:Ig-like domain-containing protein [Verrucomicrobiae bacterium]
MNLLRYGPARAALKCLMIFTLFIFSLPGLLVAQTLVNEWSFNESGGGTAIDSISSSNITLAGGASLGGGSLTLPGGSGDYAQLPDGILSTFTGSMTIETWFTENSAHTWARLFTIGGSTSTFATDNNNYIDLIPEALDSGGIHGGFWAEFNHGSGSRDAAETFPANTSDMDRTPVKAGAPVYATVVYDGPSQTARLYFNGVQVGQTYVGFKPSDLGFTKYNILGRDQYNDIPFNGAINELRIWNGAVSQRYISASLVAGPDVVITDLTPSSPSLTAGASIPLTETEQAVLTVRLPQTGTADLLATADATNWVSGNTGVLTVSSNGVINAVGLGTATVSATIAGTTVTSGSITVTRQTLQHEWSFNESGGTTAADSVGGANVTLQGGTSLGGGVLTLPGSGGSYATFPNGIVASNNSITIETWLTDNEGKTWSRAWSFGGSVAAPLDFIGPQAGNYIDLIPTAGNGHLWTEVKADIPHNSNNDVEGPAQLPTGSEQYVVVTYNAQNQTYTEYVNGVLAATVSGIVISPATLGNAMNNFIGLDQWNDSPFHGTFDEMRIWDGAVTPAYLLVAAAAGPGVVVTNTTPQTVAVTAGTSLLGSQTEQASVTVNFIQASGLSLTTVATNWTSSNPGVLTVDANGLITGVSGGSATVSATVYGVTGTSATVTVASTQPTPTNTLSNVTTVKGDNLVLRVGAYGGSLVYQWSYNSAPISGATNSTLTLTNIQISQTGTYSLLITNSFGSTNLSAVVTVVPLPILRNEWSFNESGGTTAVDAISASNITLSGSCSLGGGVLNLPGGAGNYAQFPNGILSTFSSITIETWFTDNGGLTWARPWSFGGYTTGTNNNFSHGNYIDLIPTAGNANGLNGGMWAEFNHNGNTDAHVATPLPTGTQECVTVTYQAWDQTARLYLNGVQVALATNITFAPSDLGFTYNNFLGLDQYDDTIFNGTYNEMRIWDGAAAPIYALVAAAAGPGVVVTNTTLQSAVMVTAGTSLVLSQSEQAMVTGNFIQASGVGLNTLATNWTSSNPSVLTVDANGLITGVSGGSATVSATFNGIMGTSALITVAPTQPTPTNVLSNVTVVVGENATLSVGAYGGALVYQWSFNSGPISGATSPTLTLTNLQLTQSGTYSLLITNSAGRTNVPVVVTVVPPILRNEWSFNESGGTTAFDSISSSNITLLGGTSLGSGVLTLPGGAGNYAQFPNGILSTYSNSITIETWFTDNAGLTWARPWSFGGYTTGPNNNFLHGNYIDLIPTAGGSGGMWMEFEHFGITDGVTAPLPTGTEEYVTVTYQVWDKTARLYLNGVQVATATNITYTPAALGFTYNNFLGLDQWNDPIFNGTYDEMRIWDGAVTPLYELVSAAAGPGVVVTNTTPQAVNVSVNTSVIIGQVQQASVSVNFDQVSGVSVTALATNWVSSNPSAVTVNSNGVVTAIAHGTATISATFDGITGTSSTMTVAASGPVITQEPVASLTLLVGGTLQASVAAIGDAPFTYFWFTNAGPTPISVSSSPVLTVPNLQLGNAGSYVCVVSNHVGTATSSALSLTVAAPTTYQQVMLSGNPIGYWPLNESSGTVAYDLIGGHNGTYTNNYVLGQTGPPNPFFSGATSAAFDGASGHVYIPGTPFNITGAVTVVAWVNVLSAPTFGGLFGHGDASWRMTINGNGQSGGNDGPGLPDATDPIAKPGINDGNWHMVAYTYTGMPGQSGNGRLYVDGALVASNTVATAPAGNGLDAWIGGSPDYGDRFLPAYIANAAVFAQSLNAAQVNGIYNGQWIPGAQTIAITRSGSNVILNWQTGTLLESTNLLGPWTTNSAAVPGYTVPATNSTKFFRLRVP